MSDPARCADQLTQSETRWSAPLPRTLPNSSLLTALARVFLAGEQTVEAVAGRGAETLGRQWRFLVPLAQRYVDTLGRRTRPRQREVVQFLQSDQRFRKVCVRYAAKLSIADWLAGEGRMQPVDAAAGWAVPAILSLGDLAGWLGLDANELEWFADLKRLEGNAGTNQALRNYRYRVVAKRTGGIRLIESPKRRLKALQRRVLAEILDRVPAHPAVHGFVRGRSIQTFAAPHVGKEVVLRMDLRDFFPSVSGARAQSVFRTMGYPEGVADRLGGLCTNATPRQVWKDAAPGVDAVSLREARALCARPHLPQGAPTSPALANLCAYRMDCRLAGLALAAGVSYTRYADDLAFSGAAEFGHSVGRFAAATAAIAREESFAVNFRKTRVMRRGMRQHLVGLVVNERLNVRREEFDRLKALLTNCVRHGPEGQNRENHPFFRAHVEGRVGFLESIHPERGYKLRQLLEQVDWGI